MKKHIFITAILLVFICSSCKPENEYKYKNPFRDDIIGKWKLVKSSISTSSQKSEIIDYSEDNIIYDFQANNKLVVSGVITIDTLPLFECFKEGEHFYKYQKWSDPPSDPGTNLYMDTSVYNKKSFFCNARKDEQTMTIFTNGSVVINGEWYSWSKEFVIIK